MSEGKRFKVIQDSIVKAEVFDNDEFVCCTLSDVEPLVDLLNELNDEKETYKALAYDYQKTVRHQAELLADASKKGYFPPIPEGAKYE